MNKTRISIVSYLNSKPFLYGIKNAKGLSNTIDISLDIPSKVVAKLSYNLAEVGLIPVAGLDDLDDYRLISNYCIGAEGKVRTVVLASDVPLDEVESILMDYQSRSSVLLTKVLAHFFWKKKFNWENTCAGFESKSIKGTTAGVLIGDRVFNIEGRYPYIYDLSEQWFNYTGLPFVFAVWAANKIVSEDFEKRFNQALSERIKNLNKMVIQEKDNYRGVDIEDYFKSNISFTFDKQKQAGMKKFRELAKKLVPVEFL
jgi:chorismate dehydratase